MTHIITKTYEYSEGFIDVPPGITQGKDVVQCVVMDGQEKELLCANGLSTRFNEIQTGGDLSVRAKGVAETQPVLTLDDPDYQPKRLRLWYQVSKALPIELSDDIVRRWQALYYPAEVIEQGKDSAIQHPDGQGWGGIELLRNKKAMLNYIDNMDDATRISLASVRSSRDFASQFVSWRDSLSDNTLHFRPFNETTE